MADLIENVWANLENSRQNTVFGHFAYAQDLRTDKKSAQQGSFLTIPHLTLISRGVFWGFTQFQSTFFIKTQ